MPGDPLFPDLSATQARARSPDTAGGGGERKRRRKVLSCYDCRRRKLQCDRAFPACGRCTKAGQASTCLYIDDASDTPIRGGDASDALPHELPGATPLARTSAYVPSAGDPLSRLEFQDRRIRELETALTQSLQNQAYQLKNQKMPLTPESMAGIETGPSAISATDRETMLLRGKSFKTQFHGISHPGSLIAYIPELSPFTKEVLAKFPGLTRMRKEIHALEDRADYSALKHQLVSQSDLTALIPPRTETDELIRLYFDNFDCLYHILHGPTFWNEYEQMWNDMANTRAHFVALVLLMIASSQCLQHMEPWLYSAGSSSARDKALIMNRTCEDWLASQSQKHVTAIDFQIRFLLNLSRLANASKFKRTWTDAGTLVRFSMAAGLHRNPDLLRKETSAMDKELRRRVWFAAAEFELDTAFSRGMLSTPWPQQSDYSPPNNVADEDFDESSAYLPASKPLTDFTRTSHLVAANETFMLRYSLNNILNNVRQVISFEDTKRFTEEIETQLQAIPPWTDPASLVPLAQLSINLRNYLLVLHDQQIRRSPSAVERTFSKMVIIENAKKIIDTHKSLVDQGQRVLCFLRHDQMRAAFSVCLVYSITDPHADTFLFDSIEQHAVRVVSNVVEVIEAKIERLGCEIRQLWMVLAADAFMKTKKDPSQKMLHMQTAVDTIVRQFYKILACQEDAPSSITTGSGPPTGRADLPDGMVEYLPSAEFQKPANPVTDPVLLDFDAISAWTFDDWTFNPGDLAAFDTVYPVQ